MAPRVFKRSLFGYRRSDVDEAMALHDAALDDEAKRADIAEVRADELERESRDLAGRLSVAEQIADRLAVRVALREKHIASLTGRLETLETTRSANSSDASANGAGEASADVFDGLIEVEVGPLSDFDQLASFEDAANGIGAAAAISVKRFARGRATLEMRLTEPVELLTELEERAPFEFTVRDTRSDRVVLDVDGH